MGETERGSSWRFWTPLVELFLSRNALRLVGLGIFVFVLWNINLSEVARALRRTEWFDVFVGLSLSVPLILIRAYRWNRIKRFLGVAVDYVSSCRYQVVGQMAFLTPGRVGELIKAFYLKGEGHPLGRSTASVVVDRLFDVAVILVTATVASLYFFSDFWLGMNPLVLVLGTAILLVVPALLLFWRPILEVLFRILFRVLPDWIEVKMERFLTSLEHHLKRLRALEVLLLLGLSLAAFGVQVLRIHFYARSLQITVSLLPLGGVIAIMSFSNMLPISFMGLGTRDAVFLYFLGLLNVDPERAIGLSVIILGNILLNTVVGSLLFVWDPPAVNVREYLTSNGSASSK